MPVRRLTLNRPPSPLRQDYRPQALGPGRRQKNRLRWFVSGIFLAAAFVGLIRFIQSPDSTVPALANTDAGPVEPPLVAANLFSGDAANSDFRAEELSEQQTPVAVDAAIAGMHEQAQIPAEYDKLQLEIKSGDTLDSLFRKNKLDIGDLTLIVKLPPARDQLRLLRPGDLIDIEHKDGRIRALSKEIDYENLLSVKASDAGRFEASVIPRAIEIRETMRHGIIESSLFESAITAGLDDNMIMNLAGIFAWDIDFVLDIRKNDEYFILYEEIWRDGKRVTDGEIIAAEFINRGRVVQAIRHVDVDGNSDYFAPDGRSVRKAFIRAPVDFTRISSNFNPNRRHPILNTIRAHRGVDYAAPKGTPVKAAGDGKVIFRGRKNGYGNAVIVQHGGNITTLYAHLSNFARNAPIGSRVRQGQAIGFVGATGLATAPHLHYEYRVNGVHRNPRTVKLPAAKPINAKYKDAFLETAEEALARLEQYKQTRLARLD